MSGIMLPAPGTNHPARMRVTVVDRAAMDAAWGHGLGGVILRTIEIPATCPKCGGPRGEPVMRPFFEDGESYSVSCWTNPCGHIDTYPDVLREASPPVVTDNGESRNASPIRLPGDAWGGR